MSNPLNAAVPAGFQNAVVTLIAADGTSAKVLVDTMAAALATATTPLYFGGGTMLDGTVSSTDAAAKDVLLWLGIVQTVVGASTGVATTTTGTITRAVGDFVAEGWKPGALVMLFNDTTAARQANDGVLGIITAVAAATLTVNGAPFSALTLTTGVRMCRMVCKFRAPVAASAGTNGTTPNVNLLGNGMDSAILRTEQKLGATELLAVSVAAAVSVLPAYINVGAQTARY